jgi:hypothetical protein
MTEGVHVGSDDTTPGQDSDAPIATVFGILVFCTPHQHTKDWR